VLKSQKELISRSHIHGLASTGFFADLILYSPFFSSASDMPIEKTVVSPHELRSSSHIQITSPKWPLDSSSGLDGLGKSGIESTGLRQRRLTKNENEKTFENHFYEN
jgi:hypothetical protein